MPGILQPANLFPIVQFAIRFVINERQHLEANRLPIDVNLAEMRFIHPPDSDAQTPPPSLLHLLLRRSVSPSRGAHRPLQILPACWFPDSKDCGPAAIRAEAGCRAADPDRSPDSRRFSIVCRIRDRQGLPSGDDTRNRGGDHRQHEMVLRRSSRARGTRGGGENRIQHKSILPPGVGGYRPEPEFHSRLLPTPSYRRRSGRYSTVGW